jgi:hypothetical protein
MKVSEVANVAFGTGRYVTLAEIRWSLEPIVEKVQIDA